jgi:predicted Zn-dependent protease with MMP-like domain
VIEVSVERFEELVGEALDGIPEELGRFIENVAVFVKEDEGNLNLLGLYEGIPLTRRGNYGIGMPMPDRITIYRQPIVLRCTTEAEVIEMVRITVVHEIGHHFGIDDRRLHELGYG